MSSSTEASSIVDASGEENAKILPPIPRREEDRVFYAGAAPEGWDPDVPRQSENSTEPLVDPPRALPDPYGWMRDEDRSNEEVLQHLRDENAHTEHQTKHLDGLRASIYKELLKTMKETDHSLPRPSSDIIPKSESSSDIPDRYFYYSRTIKDKPYALHCRCKIDPQIIGRTEAEESDYVRKHINLWDGSPGMPVLPDEEVYLDENTLAHGYEQFEIGALDGSPSSRFLAYTVDTTGDEIYDIVVIDMETRELIFNSNESFDPDDRREIKEDEQKDDGDAEDAQDATDEEEDDDEDDEDDDEAGISSELEWGNDDKTLYYIMQDDAQRPYRIFRKTLVIDEGEETTEDELIFEETDILFWVGMYRTLCDRYLLIETASSETSEIHFLDLNDSKSTVQCIAKRRTKVLYSVDYRLGSWWITSNVGGTPNMKLFTAPAKANCEDEWELVKFQGNVLFDGGYDIALEDVSALDTHAIAEGRQGGIPRIWVMALQGNTSVVTSFDRLEFPEAAHDVGMGGFSETNVTRIIVAYDSLVTPTQSLELPLADPNNQEARIVMKERHVTGYNKEMYACERTTVLSRDGKTKVPVSLVYRKDIMEMNEQEGTLLNVHMEAYGAYGESIEADFAASRLPLINRGIVYVIAHVRGGAEMGRQWYEEPDGAKYLCKQNTFNDFVDVARWLINDRKLTDPSLLSCEGRSAGGMTMGASINQAPELFKASILGVPFVDTIATMVDASLPLVAAEWEEWGNPNESRYLDYMLSYDPMSNVKEQGKYPSILLLAGLHDPRVQFWEATKFAATLRHHQDSTKSGPVCLKIDMSAGHFSASDRYKYLKELSFDYAFLLDQLSLPEVPLLASSKE